MFWYPSESLGNWSFAFRGCEASVFYGSERVGGSWSGRGTQAEAESLVKNIDTEDIKLGSGRTCNALFPNNT